MLLYQEALFFQHQHFPFLVRPSLKLSGLLKASIATNVMDSRPVQIEVVRKFTGSTVIGIYPSATAVTGYEILGHEVYAGQRTHI